MTSSESKEETFCDGEPSSGFECRAKWKESRASVAAGGLPPESWRVGVVSEGAGRGARWRSWGSGGPEAAALEKSQEVEPPAVASVIAVKAKEMFSKGRVEPSPAVASSVTYTEDRIQAATAFPEGSFCVRIAWSKGLAKASLAR